MWWSNEERGHGGRIVFSAPFKFLLALVRTILLLERPMIVPLTARAVRFLERHDVVLNPRSILTLVVTRTVEGAPRIRVDK